MNKCLSLGGVPVLEKLRMQCKPNGQDGLELHGSPGQNLSEVSVARKDLGNHHSLFVNGWKGREL